MAMVKATRSHSTATYVLAGIVINAMSKALIMTLKYFAEKAGFSEVDVLFTESSKMPLSIPRLREGDAEFAAFNEAMGRLSNLLYGSQDYALIARK